MKLLFNEDSATAGTIPLEPLVSFDQEMNVLNVKGFIIDLIKDVLPPFRPDQFPEIPNLQPSKHHGNTDSMAEILDKSKLDFGFFPYFPEQMLSLALQTLEIWSERLKTKEVIDYKDSQHLSMRTTSAISDKQIRPKENEDESATHQGGDSNDTLHERPSSRTRDPLAGDMWKQSLTALLTGALILFNTREGLIGFAFRSAQHGDTICRLLGGEKPFILRRVLDHWKLVGQCACTYDSARGFLRAWFVVSNSIF
jgi:hypothetical protein